MIRPLSYRIRQTANTTHIFREDYTQLFFKNRMQVFESYKCLKIPFEAQKIHQNFWNFVTGTKKNTPF